MSMLRTTLSDFILGFYLGWFIVGLAILGYWLGKEENRRQQHFYWFPTWTHNHDGERLFVWGFWRWLK